MDGSFDEWETRLSNTVNCSISANVCKPQRSQLNSCTLGKPPGRGCPVLQSPISEVKLSSQPPHHFIPPSFSPSCQRTWSRYDSIYHQTSFSFPKFGLSFRAEPRTSHRPSKASLISLRSGDMRDGKAKKSTHQGATLPYRPPRSISSSNLALSIQRR